MKTSKTTLAALAWLCFTQFSSADTILLKNGEKIEGRVLREVDGNYIVEVNVSRSIRDEKKILIDDVKSISKESDDLKAFKDIENFVPTPEMLPEAGYQSRIDKVEAFINAHPESAKVAKAKEMYDYLSEEMAVVKAGGIKFGEEMVAAQDYMANAYEYDAVIAGNRIKEAVGRRDFLSALRLFTEYDTVYSSAEGREEIVTLIKQVLSAYKANIEESLSSMDSRMEKRTAGLASMSPEDRAQTERALAEEEARIAARLAAEKGADQVWVTPDALNKESLDEALRQVESELSRISAEKREAPAVSVAETYRTAWAKLGSGTIQEKTAVLSQAESSGLRGPYLAKLRERAGIPAP